MLHRARVVQTSRLLIRLQQLDEAQRILENSVQDHPDSPPLFANLGIVAELRQDNKKALDYYEKYLAAAPAGSVRTAIEKRVADLKKRTGGQ